MSDKSKNNKPKKSLKEKKIEKMLKTCKMFSQSLDS